MPRASCAWKARSAASRPGAFADLIAVKGNPLKDLSLLTDQGRHMPLIVKGGEIVKNELNA